jgi:hypothetical protein
MTEKKVTSAATPNKRRRGNLPKAVTAILRDWLSRHKKHPYPTEEEKAALAAETNLNLNQISNWFINARRRILQPMLEQEEEEKNELDIMPYDNSRHHLGEFLFLLQSVLNTNFIYQMMFIMIGGLERDQLLIC